MTRAAAAAGHATEPVSFGVLLRRFRLAAGLTQASLAERAGLSTRGIADLERGARRHPYTDTAERLAAALGLGAAERAQFEASRRRVARQTAITTSAEPTTREPGPLIGRRDEIQALSIALEEATLGNGRLVLIAGEAGIGKTRLAEDVLQRATAAGMLSYRTACTDAGLAPAFWPWIDVLRQYRQEHRQSTTRHALDQLLADLGSGRAASSGTAEHDRFWLFDAVATFWIEASSREPIVLLLEDLHWSDASSVRLLRFVASRLRRAHLLILGTYRDVELASSQPLAKVVADLSSDSERVMLRGLNSAELTELLRALTDQEADPELVTTLHRQTGGNPLFVRELAQLLRRGAHPMRLPAMASVARAGSIRDVIQRHVRLVSRECADVLALASVVGATFDLRLLHAAAGASRKHVSEAIAEAVDARLLQPVANSPAAYTFVHALVRDALYDDLEPLRRAHLHEQVALVLESLAEDGRLSDDELAHHFTRAAVGAIELRGKALHYAERAGTRALIALAYEAAAEHFELALDLVNQADMQRRARLLLALGQARMGASDVAAARTCYEQAASVARTIAATDVLVRAALEVGVDFTPALVDPVELRLLNEALHVLGPGDSPARARLLARKAAAQRFSPNADERQALSEEAVDMARRIGDPGTLARVLFDTHLALGVATRPETRLAITTELIALAEQCGDDVLAVEGRSLKLASLLDVGDIRAFRLETELYERLVVKLRQARFLWHIPLLQATLATFEGRFENAERLVQRSFQLGQQAQQQGVLTAAPAVFSMIRFAQGRAAELESLARDQTVLASSLPAWRAVRAYALCEAGREHEARLEFDLLAADNFGRIPRDSTWPCNLALLALTCAWLEDKPRAESLYRLALPFETYVARPTRFGASCLGSMAHYTGLLAAALGRWDDAVRHFQTAIQVHLRLGAAAFAANSRYQYARALRARGAPEDAQQAAEELARAEEAASVLGITFQLQKRRAPQPDIVRR